MKKIVLSFIALLATVSVSAQLPATISEGYYRVQNVDSKRYMALLDNRGWARVQSSGLVYDLYAIRTLLDNDANNIMSNPATMVHIISPSKNNYVCSAQGVDTRTLTSYMFNILTAPNVKGAYRFSVEESVGSARLCDADYQNEDGETLADSGRVFTDQRTGRDWYITPVESGTSNYFGFSPKLRANGKYYQTFYAEFPFRIVSSGVKVYYISNIFNNKAVTREFSQGDVVPGATPLLVECSSSDASNNQIQPVLQTASAPSTNYLCGVYFNYYFNRYNRPHINRIAFDRNTMRVLRVASDGTLAFVNNPSEAANGTYYLPANEAYLSVSAGTAATVPLMSYSDFLTGIKGVTIDKNSDDQAIYTLNGVRVQNTDNLPHGVYIQGGKKIVR